MWTRKERRRWGSTCSATTSILFAGPPGDGETLVLRAATGELLGRATRAAVRTTHGHVGRHVLAWLERRRTPRIEMRDLWLDEDVWSYPFAAGSKAALVADEVVGVFQPDGEFSLIRLADGQAAGTNERLEAGEVAGGHSSAAPRGRPLPAGRPSRRRRPRATCSVQPFPNVPDYPLVRAASMPSIAHSGSKLWPAPVVGHAARSAVEPAGDLPVLVLVRQVHRSGPASSRDAEAVGDVHRQAQRPGGLSERRPAGHDRAICDLHGDPQAHTVTIIAAQPA